MAYGCYRITKPAHKFLEASRNSQSYEISTASGWDQPVSDWIGFKIAMNLSQADDVSLAQITVTDAVTESRMFRIVGFYRLRKG